jgi:ubiquinone biosynthesis protein
VTLRISAITRGPRRVRRLAHIARKAAAHGLGFFVGRLQLQKHLPSWLRPSGLGRARRPEEGLPSRLAAVLEELGPTFVKFGQMLATRPDVLPSEYVRELERICHHVAPFSGDVSRNIVARELGRPVDEIFRQFSDDPRASGSMAQVHDAVLQDGTPAVVKVRRPRIERTIEDDLAILGFIAEQADRLEEFRPLRLPMLVEEFGRGIRRELDFLSEAAHTHKFRELLREDRRVEIPEVLWSYSTDSVLTMRCIQGVHVSEVLRNAPVSMTRKRLSETILDLYLQQFFVHGLFHADPHPGNILVTDRGTVALLDFGLVGRVSSRLRRSLTACLVALGGGHLELVAEITSEVVRVPEGRERERFQDELTLLLEKYTGVPIDRLDFQRSFHDMMGIVRERAVDVPRDFVMMGRALVVITGLVTQLDPEVEFGRLARPYARELARRKLHASAVRRTLAAGAYELSSLLAEAPRDLKSLLRRLRRGAFEFRLRHEGFEEGLRELDQTGNRLSLSIILAAVIMASASLLSAEIGAVRFLGWFVSLPGLAGLAFGVVLGVWLVFGILRSGRL